MFAGQHNRERATKGHRASTPTRHVRLFIKYGSPPQKHSKKKLRTRTATESRDMQHGRRLSWHQELVGTYWRHQLVPLFDSPANALSFPLAHRSGTNLNQEPTDVGTSACLESWKQQSVEMGDAALRHQSVPLVDSPASASSLLLVHRSGTNLNQQPTDVGTSV